MKLFSKGPEKSIQEYISEAEKREGSIFLDVRTPEEYSEGHIEGSINLPLHELKKIGSVIPDQEAPVYVYFTASAGREAGARQRLWGIWATWM